MKPSTSDLLRIEERLEEARAELRRATTEGAPREVIDAAAARFHEARRASWEARGAPAPRRAAASLPSTLTGHLFTSAGSAVAHAGAARANRTVGVCLSGGGTRAASCSMGALRGLRALGLLDDVQFLSTVSGGGWAGSIYMYAPFSDDDLLGPVLPDWGVQYQTWDSGLAPFNLGALGPHAIGQFCTRLSWTSLGEGAASLWINYPSLSEHAYWPRLIGSQVLAPYGLGDNVDGSGAPTMYYTLDRSWYELAIAKYNPGLPRTSFYFVNPGRPYWVASSTFNAPALDPVPYPFWQSSFDVGIYPRFLGAGIDGRDLGGGGIDPFTFETAAPVRFDEGMFVARTPAAQYALSDAVGCSSAALGVELFANLPSYLEWLKQYISDLTPEYPYWPVMSPSQSAATYQISDGAGLDNAAICGLLGWSGASSILSFVNTDVPTIVDTGLSPTNIDAVQMDSSIPALFGWIWDDSSGAGAYRHVEASDGNLFYVRVFPYESFVDLTSALYAALQGDGAAVAKVTTRTVPNARFGVGGGRPVSVLFFFNYQAPGFWSQVSWDVWWHLEENYPFVTFPYFGTVTDLHLIPQAVNLLANLMCWSVTTNASLVRSMFGTIT
jgi:hypothetical protein